MTVYLTATPDIRTASTFALRAKTAALVASLRKKRALDRAVCPAGVLWSEWEMTQRERVTTDGCPDPSWDCLWTAAC